jgi:beta-glucanase (GH16 family)
MQNRFSKSLAALTLALLASPTLLAQSLNGWTLTFDDEFNATSLDTTNRWKTCFRNQGTGTFTPCTLAGNGELELYDPSTQFTEGDGVLQIRADKRDVVDPIGGATYHYVSGVISTDTHFQQTHGYFEMRAKLPPGKGLWPAFWMEDSANTWPPEVDVMEMIGSMPDAPHVAAIRPSGSSGFGYLSQYIYTFDTSTAYHTYGVEWDATNLTYYYDGQFVAQTNTDATMTQDMELIANLAVGGNWPGSPDGTTVFPAYMGIDYIRAWTRSNTSAAIPYTAGTDVGTVGLAGSTDLTTANAATIKGAGSGYFQYAEDSFHYAAQPLPGDGDFVMKVISVPPPVGSYTPQTGIMVRATMDKAAPYTAVFLANSKCILQSRTSQGGVTSRIATLTGISYPSWIRLIRKGTTFNAYVSPDGLTWSLVGTTINDISSITMGSSALIGAAVSSGNPAAYNTASIPNFNQPAVQITQDNADTTGVTFQGTWPLSTNVGSGSSPTPGAMYDLSHVTDGNAAHGTKSVTFTPTIPSSGRYDVYFRWVGFEANRNANVPVEIDAADGPHTVYVNEQHNGAEWNLLGTFPFDAGTTDSVIVRNDGTLTVSVDAVRFSPGVPAP